MFCHSVAFTEIASRDAFRAGMSLCFTLTAAAMFIAVGKESLDGWDMSTWSFG
jgi:hypothetical protein